ncbi:lycopene beta-cyclase CrtY [Sphingosinicella sp. CPCC 101087]|uniref:lycopene beta-cyclase CrtY n=1 Tax=Sphingosinicella sp. CPCC 101087 TaxID=2497754 RepID=UPI00101C33FD|nr:lycopene beta-cyclase CrtY [Sphingosinicella sp. CPCC 101087]
MGQVADRLIIAGGGLSGCFAALALAKLRQDVPILLLESGQTFGGNHTWSFFETDVEEDSRWLVDPLVAARWDAYDIRFPKRRRTLGTSYNSVTSDRLDRTVRDRLRPDQYRLGSRIEAVAPDHVRLAGGERIAAAGVIDARGPANLSVLEPGWQKFVGCEYRFDRPHGLVRPIVMDATVDQAEGYRFVYCLPFSDTRMLVEDTYYSLSPALDVPTLRKRIRAYVEASGWKGATLEREETGVLPVAMGGQVDALWKDLPGVAKLGLRGGFFHPTTGYSLPDAVRMAVLAARQADLGGAALHHVFQREAARLWKERRFYRLLNRMLFRAVEPAQRYKVLEHFYRLDPNLVARFYAGRSSLADKVRILSGKPPVPVGRALAALLGQGSHSE